jgi:hypothetical protein
MFGRAFLSKYPKGATSAHKVGKIGWIQGSPVWVATLVLASSLAASSAGCAAEVPEGPAEAAVVLGTSQSKIFGGAKDDDGDSIAGVVALRVGAGSTFELCTGALIAPNVVLTARHCVTKNITSSVSCDENGQSANGEHVSGDEDPKSVGIYTGALPSFAKPPSSVARAIVAPSGPYLCNSDIALIVLAKPITDVAPLMVRTRGFARAGEVVRAIGYGQNDASSPIGTRFRKPGVEVLAQGKAVSDSKTPLGTHEFEVGKSICQGDSGGPAISEDTGAVIGVVSRGGGCDEEFGHIYTTTAGFDELFARAFEIAGTEPVVEDSADPQPQVTHAKTTSASTSAKDEGAQSSSCAVAGAMGATGSTLGSSPRGLGFVGIAAAIGALAARRRRAA